MVELLADKDIFLLKFLEYLLENYIEIIATLTGLIYLIYSVRENKLLWVFGLITSSLYVYVFLRAQIYADMGINIYYVLVSVYGWFHWNSQEEKSAEKLPVSRLTRRSMILVFLITAAIFVFIAFVLVKFTDSDIAYWDAFTTSASITATWMLARKILEHWLIWIVVDAVSAGLYIYKGLYPTVLLFIVYTSIAILGYFEWKRTWRKEKQLHTA